MILDHNLYFKHWNCCNFKVYLYLLVWKRAEAGASIQENMLHQHGSHSGHQLANSLHFHWDTIIFRAGLSMLPMALTSWLKLKSTFNFPYAPQTPWILPLYASLNHYLILELLTFFARLNWISTILQIPFKHFCWEWIIFTFCGFQKLSGSPFSSQEI